MVDICHFSFAKTHRTYNTRSETECKLWTLCDMCAHVGSLVATNTTLVGNVHRGRCAFLNGGRVHEGTLYEIIIMMMMTLGVELRASPLAGNHSNT
jgi:hypothetical protein